MIVLSAEPKELIEHILRTEDWSVYRFCQETGLNASGVRQELKHGRGYIRLSALIDVAGQLGYKVGLVVPGDGDDEPTVPQPAERRYDRLPYMTGKSAFLVYRFVHNFVVEADNPGEVVDHMEKLREYGEIENWTVQLVNADSEGQVLDELEYGNSRSRGK